MGQAVSNETEQSIVAARQKTRGQELSLTMRNIKSNLVQISEALSKGNTDNGFKLDDFQYELNETVKELERVRGEFKRYKR